MDPGDQSLSLDEFSTWKIDALRDFLTKRGLAKDGNKSELAALCFSAHVMKLPVIPSAAEVLKQNILDYERLLVVDSTNIPDPFKIYSDWLGEKSGIGKWPPIYLTDIATYLSGTAPADLVKNILQDYKTGKAYQYFDREFLQEIFFYDVFNSPFCILRSRCKPSMNFKDGHHNLWVCAEKTTGEIKSSYCSCAAGLGGTCNHIAAILFRVESANKLGITSCTSVPCQWTIPARTKEIRPTKITDLKIAKTKYGDTGKKRPLVSMEKKGYEPLSNIKVERSTFIDAIKKTLPNACVFKGISDGENPGNAASDQQRSKPLNKALPADVTQYTMKTMVSHCKDQSAFVNSLPVYTKAEVEDIQSLTTGQGNNKFWHDIRAERITSSNFYTIHTKVSSSKRKPVDFSNNIASIMGYVTTNPNLKSLKHGRETEPVAKTAYKDYMKHVGHNNLEISECGVFVDTNHSYFAASPDLLISCDCCGLGVVEIKCPLIQKCSSCSGFCFCSCPDYLDKESYMLRKHHAYYGQIQGQLGITGRQYCDFFIYTCNGAFVQRITFDKVFYLEMLNNLVYFYMNYIVPEMFTREIQRRYENMPKTADQLNGVELMDAETTYFCPVCNDVVENQENVKSFKDHSICCDSCELWYHFKCVNVNKQMALKAKKWSCKNVLVLNCYEHICSHELFCTKINL